MNWDSLSEKVASKVAADKRESAIPSWLRSSIQAKTLRQHQAHPRRERRSVQLPKNQGFGDQGNEFRFYSESRGKPLKRTK